MVIVISALCHMVDGVYQVCYDCYPSSSVMVLSYLVLHLRRCVFSRYSLAFLTTITWVVCCHWLESSKWPEESERKRDLHPVVCGIYYFPFFSLLLRTFPSLLLFDSIQFPPRLPLLCFPPVHQAWLRFLFFSTPRPTFSHSLSETTRPPSSPC